MLSRVDLRGAARYTHLGITLAATTLGCFFLGWWLDGKIGTKPLLAIIGAFVGATGGFINLIRTLKKIQQEQEEADRDAGDE